MKQLNVKPHGLRAIVTLFLLFALQAFTIPKCGGNKKESSGQEEVPNIEAFHKAVGKRDLRKVQFYLEKISFWPKEKQEEFLNSVSDGTTALGNAIEKGNAQIVDELIKQPQIDINKTGKKHFPSLLLALKCNKEAIAQILLTKCGDKTLNITDRDPDSGNTPLHLAAREGYVYVVDALLKYYNADVNVKNKYEDTSLHLAVKNRHIAVVERLVKATNIDLHTRNNDGNTPLDLARDHGYGDIVKCLMSEAIKQQK